MIASQQAICEGLRVRSDQEIRHNAGPISTTFFVLAIEMTRKKTSSIAQFNDSNLKRIKKLMQLRSKREVASDFGDTYRGDNQRSF